MASQPKSKMLHLHNQLLAGKSMTKGKIRYFEILIFRIAMSHKGSTWTLHRMRVWSHRVRIHRPK